MGLDYSSGKCYYWNLSHRSSHILFMYWFHTDNHVHRDLNGWYLDSQDSSLLEHDSLSLKRFASLNSIKTFLNIISCTCVMDWSHEPVTTMLSYVIYLCVQQTVYSMSPFVRARFSLYSCLISELLVKLFMLAEWTIIFKSYIDWSSFITSLWSMFTFTVEVKSACWIFPTYYWLWLVKLLPSPFIIKSWFNRSCTYIVCCMKLAVYFYTVYVKFLWSIIPLVLAVVF